MNTKKPPAKVSSLLETLKYIVFESSAIRYDGLDDLFERSQKIHNKAKEALLEYGIPFDYVSRGKKP